MIIASWNVNSIKSRLPQVLDWLSKNKIDVLMLQELKGLDFPAEAFRNAGYQSAFVAQKAYNGVATVSRYPIGVVSETLKGDAKDSHARYLETDINGLRLINIYLPNGNPIGSEKFAYKISWMRRLKKRLAALQKAGDPAIVGGDFNVIPTDLDCFDPKYWRNDALFQPEAKQKYQELLNTGYIDAFRRFHAEGGHYTFWEYFRDHFRKNNGIRIDHFLVSSLLEKKLVSCTIDKNPRAADKPSDHTPIVLKIK